ncbi:MAG: 4Fe-4S dicluster domain-containing protein [Desulfobacteraceae bacterium]|nr:MAG: 4Fe-4S dicluster domain-containing protein [Desulfobacteraceae bacterium]
MSVPRLRYLKDVVTLSFHEERCVGCGMCLAVCPHGVFSMDNGKARVGDRDACMECGACSMNCPAEAITVKKGVGCAAAVINSFLGRRDTGCCCIIEPEDEHARSGG